MQFEIDVSGEDILSKDYSICIASKDGVVRGFKFDSKLIQIIRLQQSEGKYRYGISRYGKTLLKIRLYCIILYYLFKSINLKNEELNLKICRDFHGHEREINSNLKYFLKDKLDLNINIRHLKLDKDSIAHHQAVLMRKDVKNEMNC